MSKDSSLAVNIRKTTGERRAVSTLGSNHAGANRPGGLNRFKPGQSGNPNGRPAGSRNLSYQHLHGLMMAQGDAVVATVLAAALSGDTAAMKLALDRILPRRVCNPISDVTLPPLRTAADATLALGDIAAAALDGRITAEEAAALASIVEVFVKVAATHEHERRIVELEQRLGAQQ